MAPIAILSDIHSNYEALTAVMAKIDSLGITPDRIVCLGDVIGYGPEPIPCLDIAMDWRFTLMGNHEEAVVTGLTFAWGKVAREAILWTRALLKPGVLSMPKVRKRWKFLESLELKVEDGNTLYVHGSPRDPTMEYILKVDTEPFFGEVPKKIQEIFDMIKGPCFVGHSHTACLINEEFEYHLPPEIEYTAKLQEDRKYIVNVGSVGQPRDGDTRACFATVEDDILRWHRVEYDFKPTMAKIRAIPALNERLAVRLEQGH